MIDMPLYTIKQVATMLDVDEETVRRWIKSKKIIAEEPRSRKNGYKISRENLLTFVQRNPKYSTYLRLDDPSENSTEQYSTTDYWKNRCMRAEEKLFKIGFLLQE